MDKPSLAIAAPACLVLGLATGWGCGSGSGKVLEANTHADLPAVAVAKASPQDLSRTLVLTAEFKPYQEVDVMAKVAGYVKQIRVDIGDRVRQGELLATLEVPEMADDLSRAKASLDRSNAEVRRAGEELQRAQSAHEVSHLTYTRLAGVMKDRPGLVAQQEVDDARGKDLVSEAQVSAAKSSLVAAQEQVNVAQAELNKVKTLSDYTRVIAPFDGVVTKRYADTGSMIQAGVASQTQAMPVVRLCQNNLLRLILPVPESVVPAIRAGQAVEVSVPSLKRTFPGRVARFANQVQLDTRTMATEVDVENPQLVLIPGMYAEVDLTLERRKRAIAIPIAAVGGSETDPIAYIVNADRKVEIRHIQTGLETANRVEVRSGLQDGDLVVIGNRNQLTAGQQVEPKITELAALNTDQSR
jgi:RND family efflux transporter MFP subunit